MEPVRADDGVAFPMAAYLPSFNFCRPCRYVSFSGQDASGILAIVTLSALFGHDSQVGIEPPTALFVFEDVLVDGLVADRERSVALQMIGDLLRAPFLLKVVGD